MVSLKNLVRIGVTRKDATVEARAITKNLARRGINREAKVVPVSQKLVRSLTRKGFKIRKKNFGIAMRDKKKRKR